MVEVIQVASQHEQGNPVDFSLCGESQGALIQPRYREADESDQETDYTRRIPIRITKLPEIHSQDKHTRSSVYRVRLMRYSRLLRRWCPPDSTYTRSIFRE